MRKNEVIRGGNFIKNTNYLNYQNKYISLKNIEDLKKEYFSDSKITKKGIKEFYKIIEKHNTNYINELKENVELLKNINGYPLDEHQCRVVLSEEEAILVVAGAGSGKSLTIIGKIAYLVKECGIKPEDILCISFTNDATINLKNNIKKNYDFNIDIYTFHKLSLEILKQNKIEYQIAPENYLNEIIDNFFETIIPSNKKMKNALNKVLGKKYCNMELNNLKRLIATFISLFKSNNYPLSYYLNIINKLKYTINIKEYYKNKYLILLIFNIYLLYENELSKENALDFNDMINKSISVLKNNGLKKQWKYIIIDEYQDTSFTKFQLINEIKKITNAKLLAVGDDFQSIYRFTGCDLNIFLKFTSYFSNAKIFQIVNTYRNPQELIDIAGKFIMKNKLQQKKILYSSKHLKNPIVLYYKDNKIKALKEILTILNNQNKEDILVLGRNNNDINNYIDNLFQKKDNFFTYNEIRFRYLTIHKSKGLESENVILINMEDNLLGMPTKIKDEKILKYVNNTKDYFPYEEERRLFYVALTRTKNRVYIICPYKKESIFIKELRKNKKNIKIIKS